MKKRIIAVVGPTASGKTGLAIEIAKRLSGEIVSCDSMQIYKDIPIDGVQVHLDSAKYAVKYRVSAKDCSYYEWVTDYSNDPETGYAGEYGKPIDRLQMYIVKK